MTKNILVIDTSGKTAGVTYPKRAKGLLRKGRAILLDETTIQLKEMKGSSPMTPKEALLATINEMNETQIQSLLVFLDTFKTDAPKVTIPAMAQNSTDVRSEMMHTLQNQIEVLAQDNYASPHSVDVLKELKDILNMILRTEN